MVLRRRVILVVWVVVGVLVLTGVYWAARVFDHPFVAPGLKEAERRAAAAGVPLTQAEIVPERPVPDEENAAAGLRKAFSLMADAQLSRVRPGAGGTSEATAADLRAASPALAAAVEASKRPRLDWGWDYDEGAASRLPELEPFKEIGWWLSARALASAQAGRLREAVDDLAAVQRLSALGAQNPVMLTYLVSIAMDTTAFNTAARMVAERPQDAALRAAVRRDLLAPPNPDEFYRCLKGEAYAGVASARNLPRFGGIEAFSDTEGPVIREEIPLKREGAPDGAVGRAYLVRIFEYWTRILPSVRKARTPEEIAELGNGLLKSEEWHFSHGLSRAMIGIMAPLNADFADAYVMRESRRRLLTAYLDVLDARVKTGAFPDRLPATAAALVDPFDGKPLRYERTPDGFRVWSVARDRRDDGGRTSREAADAPHPDPDRPRPVDMVYAYPWPYR